MVFSEKTRDFYETEDEMKKAEEAAATLEAERAC